MSAGGFDQGELIDSSFRERLTEPWRCHGVIGYVAPEQALAYYDVPSIKNDLYSLALTAIESITGRSLFGDLHQEESILDVQGKITGPGDLENLHSSIWTLFDTRLHSFLLTDARVRNTDIEQLRHVIRQTLRFS